MGFLGVKSVLNKVLINYLSQLRFYYQCMAHGFHILLLFVNGNTVTLDCGPLPKWPKATQAEMTHSNVAASGHHVEAFVTTYRMKTPLSFNHSVSFNVFGDWVDQPNKPRVAQSSDSWIILS